MLKTCPHCDQVFESNHARRIYCSDSHRVSAYNKRKGFKVMMVAPEQSSVSFKEERSEKPVYNNTFLKQTAASTTGNLAAQVLTNLLTKEENKPIKKKDLQDLFQAIRKDQQFFHSEIKRYIDYAIKQRLNNPYL